MFQSWQEERAALTAVFSPLWQEFVTSKGKQIQFSKLNVQQHLPRIPKNLTTSKLIKVLLTPGLPAESTEHPLLISSLPEKLT